MVGFFLGIRKLNVLFIFTIDFSLTCFLFGFFNGFKILIDSFFSISILLSAGFLRGIIVAFSARTLLK